MIKAVLKTSRLVRWRPSPSGHRFLYISDARALSRRQTLGLGLFLFAGSTVSAYALYRLQPTQTLHCDANANERFLSRKGRRHVEELLNERSESYIPNKDSGFKRFDFAQAGRYAYFLSPIPSSGIDRNNCSNEPVEDYHAELFLPRAPGNSSWSFFAIFDGHSGCSTASWLSEHLLPSVARALKYEALLKAQNTAIPSTSQLDAQDKVITDTFVALDDEIVNDALELAFSQSSVSKAQSILTRAISGSCALVAFYDSASSTIKVANVGDSRAVLGRLTKRGKDGEEVYEVIPLSYDHNGLNPAEVSRLTALHSGEDLFSTDGTGRFIGWGCARAFGDGRTKWSKESQEKLWKEYLGRRPAPTLKTPPYFTAEPEIVTATVKEGDFLIMASDGLWECLTSEEAVGLVGRWKQTRDMKGSASDFTTMGEELPVLQRGSEDQGAVVGKKGSKDKEQENPSPRYRQWNTPKTFTFTQARRESSAEHLLRNALGGGNDDLREALLNMRGSRARQYR
jgi:pyruvate dehydrogenase phosphatase